MFRRSEALSVRGPGVVGRWVEALRQMWRKVGAKPDPTSPRVDALPPARLRDLGFEADQVGGSIDSAKGQHHRHL